MVGALWQACRQRGVFVEYRPPATGCLRSLARASTHLREACVCPRTASDDIVILLGLAQSRDKEDIVEAHSLIEAVGICLAHLVESTPSTNTISIAGDKDWHRQIGGGYPTAIASLVLDVLRLAALVAVTVTSYQRGMPTLTRR